MNLYKVVGMHRAEYDFNDKHVAGYKVSVISPYQVESEGCEAFNFFYSDSRISSSGYKPCVGDYINIYYNRFGKIDTIIRSDER